MADRVAEKVEQAVLPVMPIPAFGDIGKAANDLLNKDFYHTAQGTLDVKLKVPNGTNITVKGKQGFDGVTSGSFEGKHTPSKGVTITESWATNAILDTKIELQDIISPGVKFEYQNVLPLNGETKAPVTHKGNFAFKNPNVHARVFNTYLQSNGAINSVVDVVAGDGAFLVGAEAGYDVQKGAISKYSLALGYQTPKYTASVISTQNLQLIAATFYQKVNATVEVSARAGFDVQAQKASGVEVGSKYKLDPLSFAKAKINDRGIMALAYSTKLNAGTTLGLGLSLDTQKMNEAGHKIGTSLTFEG